MVLRFAVHIESMKTSPRPFSVSLKRAAAAALLLASLTGCAASGADQVPAAVSQEVPPAKLQAAIDRGLADHADAEAALESMEELAGLWRSDDLREEFSSSSTKLGELETQFVYGLDMGTLTDEMADTMVHQYAQLIHVRAIQNGVLEMPRE